MAAIKPKINVDYMGSATVVSFTDEMIYIEAGCVQSVGPPFRALAKAGGNLLEGLVENTLEGRVASRQEGAGTLKVAVGPVTFMTRDHGEAVGSTVAVAPSD